MTISEETMIAWAVEEGFAGAALATTDQIEFDDIFRQYCAENHCGQYGVNHSCPPICGTTQQMRERLQSHSKALVLQTIWEISDYSDMPALKKAKQEHNAALLRLIKRLRAQAIDGVIVGASGCSLCSPCTAAAGEPCRFPEYRFSCMSAYCVFVRKLTDACGLEYDCGEGLLAFFGMYVFD